MAEDEHPEEAGDAPDMPGGPEDSDRQEAAGDQAASESGSADGPPPEAPVGNVEEAALAQRSIDLSPASDDGDGDSRQMPFLDHLEELRWRILKGLAAILVGAVVCLVYASELQDFLTAPFKEAVAILDEAEPGVVAAIRSWFAADAPADSTAAAGEEADRSSPPAPRRLQALGVMTLFFVNLQIAVIGGAVLALPVLFYQFWQFVAPGLLSREKRLMLPIVGLSVLCFAIGATMAYMLVLPLGLRFFLALESSNVTSQWAIDQYIGFVLRLILGFGIVFEMPVVTLFLSRIGLVTPEYLRRVRRYAIIIVFALAAIFTPPDPISQLLMALPLLALYEISIWVSRVTHTRKAPEPETDD